MKSPTVFFFYCLLASTLCLFPVSADAFGVLDKAPITANNDLNVKNLNKVLFSQLLADQLISMETQYVKIEFEYHDIFVNERILSYELITKYQKIFTDYGIHSGPQRQIHIYTNGDILIGDFGQYDELLKEAPIEELSEI